LFGYLTLTLQVKTQYKNSITMKTTIKILMLVVGFFFVSGTISYAENDSTERIIIKESQDQERTRSICPVEAWYQGTNVYISFLDQPVIATISIINILNGEVTTNVYQSPQTILIPVYGGSGEYQIEVSYDSKSFVGHFELK
jgi:hypothetical protein